MAANAQRHQSQTNDRSLIFSSQPEGGFVLTAPGPDARITYHPEQSAGAKREVLATNAAETKKLDRVVYGSWSIDAPGDSTRALTAPPTSVRPNSRWWETLSAVTPFLTDYRRLFGGCSAISRGGIGQSRRACNCGIEARTRRPKESPFSSVRGLFRVLAPKSAPKPIAAPFSPLLPLLTR